MRKIDPTGLDAYKPAQIASLIEQIGVAKARLSPLSMLTLAVLAGAFIALGGAAYTMSMTGVEPSFGPARILGGVVFSLGLILVVVGGAELFTGNALMVMAAIDRKISIGELGRNWVIVYLGNFIGALAVAVAVYLAGTLNGPMGETAAGIVKVKLSLSWSEALFRGILCNMLVCLAIWLTLAARTIAGKIAAIIWPVTAFVALGFEHSVANMYLLPQGILSGAPAGVSDVITNLFFVTLGNVIGGAGGVALSYHLAYGSNPHS
jgi:formate/nitrite transporter